MVSNNLSLDQEKEIENRYQSETPIIPETDQEIEARYKYEDALEKAKGPGQGLLATAEGLAEGVAGPLATAAEEAIYRATGAEAFSPEMRRARGEEYPVAKGAAEFVGFGGSLLTGVGEARVLEKIGETGLKYLPKVSKVIGSNHMRAIIETGALSAGHEATKWLNQDPNQTVGTALFDVTLSGALGGGMSVGMSKFMQSTLGKKVAGNLKALSDHYGGIEGVSTDSASQIEAATGISLEKELRGGLNSEEGMRILNKLNQTDTSSSGLALQKTFKEFKDETASVLAETLGSKVESIPKKLDIYKAGNDAARSISEAAETLLSPLSKEFDKIAEEAQAIELVPDVVKKVQTEETLRNPYLTPKFTEEKIPGITSEATDNVLQLAKEQGWDTSSNSEIMKVVNQVIEDLPKQKTLKDLRNMIRENVTKRYQKNPPNGEFNYDLGNLSATLRDMEITALERHYYENLKPGTQQKLFDKSATLSSRISNAREEWAKASKILEPMMEQLSLKGSVSGFPKRLLEKARKDGEAVFRQLSGRSDAFILDYISKNFPETANVIRRAHVEDILSGAMKDGRLVPERIINDIKKLSPQLQDFVMGNQAQKIEAISSLLDKFKDPKHNFSNTARALSSHFKFFPATGTALATALLGHGLPMAAITGVLSNQFFNHGPDAVRLTFLKWLGTPKQIEPAAFRAMGEFFSRTIRGENFLRKATESVFESGSKKGLQNLLDEYWKEERLDKLEKKLLEFEKDPGKFEQVGKNTSYYMPEEAMSIVATTSQAVAYLNERRPRAVKVDPLGPEIEPTEGQKQAFRELLKIAEQPLSLFQYMKEGTLSQDQVEDLQNMYPASYTAMANSLRQQVTEHLAEGKDIPYQLKQQISVFLGQPLDSSFEDQNVALNQEIFAHSGALMQEQMEQQRVRPSKTGMAKMKRDKRLSLELSDTA